MSECKAVTAYTRASQDGTCILCPCGYVARVFHFAWSALVCPQCGQQIDKHDWTVVARNVGAN